MADNGSQELKAKIDTALQIRLQGNEKFLAGDSKGALKDYHTVLLSLRGLDSAIQEVRGDARRPASEADADAALQKELNKKCRDALLATQVNMAAIHAKNSNWKRALDCAKDARKIDEDHVKARYREAQARYNLGEVLTAKRMFEELNKTNPDQAFIDMLKKIALDEKPKPSKVDEQFRGMFTSKGKKPEAKTAESKSGPKASTSKA